MICYQDTLNFISTNFHSQLDIFVKNAFLLTTFLVFILIHKDVGVQVCDCREPARAQDDFYKGTHSECFVIAP